jgi:hypothetical protein
LYRELTPNYIRQKAKAETACAGNEPEDSLTGN